MAREIFGPDYLPMRKARKLESTYPAIMLGLLLRHPPRTTE
jgi:hypothetical protein